ncbi:MAG: hypothetical protein Q4Q07_04325 [Tissierellia bacterium]|nr:hypothetical protein [Tissierellia bacterium]
MTKVRHIIIGFLISLLCVSFCISITGKFQQKNESPINMNTNTKMYFVESLFNGGLPLKDDFSEKFQAFLQDKKITFIAKEPYFETAIYDNQGIFKKFGNLDIRDMGQGGLLNENILKDGLYTQKNLEELLELKILGYYSPSKFKYLDEGFIYPYFERPFIPDFFYVSADSNVQEELFHFLRGYGIFITLTEEYEEIGAFHIMTKLRYYPQHMGQVLFLILSNVGLFLYLKRNRKDSKLIIFSTLIFIIIWFALYVSLVKNPIFISRLVGFILKFQCILLIVFYYIINKGKFINEEEKKIKVISKIIGIGSLCILLFLISFTNFLQLSNLFQRHILDTVRKQKVQRFEPNLVNTIRTNQNIRKKIWIPREDDFSNTVSLRLPFLLAGISEDGEPYPITVIINNDQELNSEDIGNHVYLYSFPSNPFKIGDILNIKDWDYSGEGVSLNKSKIFRISHILPEDKRFSGLGAEHSLVLQCSFHKFTTLINEVKVEKIEEISLDKKNRQDVESLLAFGENHSIIFREKKAEMYSWDIINTLDFLFLLSGILFTILLGMEWISRNVKKRKDKNSKKK